MERIFGLQLLGPFPLEGLGIYRAMQGWGLKGKLQPRADLWGTP